ncbi:MAG TPA: hypothetical protein VGG74_04035 [Kofleriaceae bacterium]|jgi:hypothetical protein
MLNDITGDVLHVFEKRLGAGESHFAYAVHSQRDVSKLELAKPRILEPVRAWAGDIVFDHVRGARQLDASPRCEPPYMLVVYEQYFDWDSGPTTYLTKYDDLAVALAEAQKIVTRERAYVFRMNHEIGAVYVIRVREVLVASE